MEFKNLELIFHSKYHIRHENGRHVAGNNTEDTPRTIIIEKNISGLEGFTASIVMGYYDKLKYEDSYRSDSLKYNMTAKRMKLVTANDKEIHITGFGNDPMGFSFKDYALLIKLANSTGVSASGIIDPKSVASVKLLLLDRNITIEYFPLG